MSNIRSQVLLIVLYLNLYKICGLLNGNRLPTSPSHTASTAHRGSDTETLHQLLSQEFSELEKMSRTLIQRVTVLESKNSNLERELQEQKGKIAVLQQENNNIKQQLTRQTTEIASLQKDLNSCLNSTNFLTKDIGLLKENVTILSLCCENNEQNMTRIEEKIDRVESSVLQQMQNDKLIQEGEIENMSDMVDKLKIQNRYISLTLVDLQSNVIGMNNSLFNAVSDLNDYVNGSLLQMNEMVAKIQKDDLAVVSSLRALNGSYHSFEYFTDMETADEDVHDGQTVKFTQVKNNFGSRYDANTGIFRSDRSGFFIFFFGVECHGGNVGAELVRDGSIISVIYCQSHDLFVQSGAMAVTKLSPSSSVWVKIIGKPTSQIHGKSAFVGVQIK